MDEAISYGWAGKILRVNLTSGAISVEPTDPYKDLYIGGMGIANKILYDEVEPGTDPLSPENKIIFAVGPLTASGMPMGGRATICTMSPFSKYHLPIDAHCGGMIGARIKQAGWDAIIIEGAAESPCYINIVDDKVEIKDASEVWGLGTRKTTEILNRRESTRACVASIGPAGENLLPYSNIMNSRNHSAGAGTGAVMGSKKCKALVVEGNGAVRVADPQAVMDLSDYVLKELLGSNNNHSVPSTQQEWAEYYDPSSRWTARKGLYWAAAEGEPIETGEPKPGELNTIGYRCMKSTKDLGDIAEQYTVKMNGCHGCPIHCHADLSMQSLDEHSTYTTAGNTCAPQGAWSKKLSKKLAKKFNFEQDEETKLVWNLKLLNLIDDLGIWCNYSQLWTDLAHCITSGTFERNCPEEYAAIDWGKFERNDSSILDDLMNMLARNDSQMALVAHGPVVWCEKWGEEDWFDTDGSGLVSYLGWPEHHYADDVCQMGVICNGLFNRDPMIHSGTNFFRQGFPDEIKHEIAAELWGDPDVYTPADFHTPFTEAKAYFTWWCVVTDVLHDSLTACNWVLPFTCSPNRSRNYRGDLDVEAKFYKAVTGVDVTTDQLYEAGARIMTLRRAMAVRGMNTIDLHGEHDRVPDWPFETDPDVEPFSEGTSKLDRDDIEKGYRLTYQQFGWDENLGCPTAECLDRYGLSDVRDDLAARGLLP